MVSNEIVDRPLPARDVLVDRLTRALGEQQPVQVLDRHTKQSGTFPKEIVRCLLGGGREITLFCKYSAPRFDAFGHRRGVAYEADVYRRLLVTMPLTLPTYAGSYNDTDSGESWLLLHDLAGGIRSRREWRRLADVATWLGLFHRLTPDADRDPRFDFLIRYDDDYYLGWSKRVARFSQHLHRDLPWLPDLCVSMPSFVKEITSAPQTIVHGEFTVNNVMLVGDDVYPTDWESTAVGLGEIDLVCLLDNWPDDIAAGCTASYAAARWPDGQPHAFTRNMLLAELYMQLRWLGEDRETLQSGAAERRLDRLATVASALVHTERGG